VRPKKKLKFQNSGPKLKELILNNETRLNDEAPSDIPKGEWELILGNTEVLMKSAKA